MLSERNKRILMLLAGVAAQKILKPSDPERGVSDPSPDTDPRINRTAKPGEKVIALSNDDRAGVGDAIHRGELLTVESFHLDAYTFQECPPCYDPYLGGTATQWHTAKFYMLVNDTSRAIVQYLDSIETSTEDRIQEIVRKVQEYKPKEKFGLVVSKEKIELVLSEYEAVVLGCTPVFEESIKGEYDVKEFICGLGGAVPDEDVVINNNRIKGSLQRVCGKVKQGISSTYHSINLTSGEKIIEDIACRFSAEFNRERRNICDTICDPYMEYIIQSLA